MNTYLDPEFEESVSVLQTSKHSISSTGTATKTKGISEESNSPRVGVQNSASDETATQASPQEIQEQMHKNIIRQVWLIICSKIHLFIFIFMY